MTQHLPGVICPGMHPFDLTRGFQKQLVFRCISQDIHVLSTSTHPPLCAVHILGFLGSRITSRGRPVICIAYDCLWCWGGWGDRRPGNYKGGKSSFWWRWMAGEYLGCLGCQSVASATITLPTGVLWNQSGGVFGPILGSVITRSGLSLTNVGAGMLRLVNGVVLRVLLPRSWAEVSVDGAGDLPD